MKQHAYDLSKKLSTLMLVAISFGMVVVAAKWTGVSPISLAIAMGICVIAVARMEHMGREADN